MAWHPSSRLAWPPYPGLAGWLGPGIRASAVPPIRLPLPVMTGEIRPPPEDRCVYLAVDPIFVWTPSSINSNHHHRPDLPTENIRCVPCVRYITPSHSQCRLGRPASRGRDGLAIPIRALMALQPAYGGTACQYASALQLATPAALLPYPTMHVRTCAGRFSAF